jgi:hypothetical protein
MPRPAGLPKTGGRQRGTPNRVKRPSKNRAKRAQSAVNAAVDAAIAANETPLAYMLRIIRDPAADERRRDMMAVAAAPYLHPKLMAAQVRTEVRTGPVDGQMTPDDYRLWARNEIRRAFDLPMIEHHEAPPGDEAAPRAEGKADNGTDAVVEVEAVEVDDEVVDVEAEPVPDPKSCR